MRKPLQEAEERRDEDRRRGRDTAFADKQITFTMEFHHLSFEELGDLVAEGDRLGWWEN
jgi:hypothetical protein